MAESIECVSPVDGRVYASRRVAGKKEITAVFARRSEERRVGKECGFV